MDGIKKTALFLSGLDYSAVDQVLGRLDAESARKVRREMMSLRPNTVSVQESHRLDHEFLQKVGWKRRKQAAVSKYAPQNQLQGQPEHQFAGSATYQPPKQKPVRFDVESFIPNRRPFDFLRDRNTNDIVRELVEEHPQTIAVVLAHLPRSRAGEVLSQLSPTLKADVTERLAHFEPTNEELLYEIESTLRSRMYAAASSGRSVTFDDLNRFSNSDLSTLFHSVDAATAMLSLIGAEPALIERVTKRFSPTEEHQMRQLLKRLGSINEDDVNRAKNAIMERAEHLLVNSY